jgi:hypothetical protein
MSDEQQQQQQQPDILALAINHAGEKFTVFSHILLDVLRRHDVNEDVKSMIRERIATFNKWNSAKIKEILERDNEMKMK